MTEQTVNWTFTFCVAPYSVGLSLPQATHKVTHHPFSEQHHADWHLLASQAREHRLWTLWDVISIASALALPLAMCNEIFIIVLKFILFNMPWHDACIPQSVTVLSILSSYICVLLSVFLPFPVFCLPSMLLCFSLVCFPSTPTVHHLRLSSLSAPSLFSCFLHLLPSPVFLSLTPPAPHPLVSAVCI